jgi:hypothetical protein
VNYNTNKPAYVGDLFIRKNKIIVLLVLLLAILGVSLLTSACEGKNTEERQEVALQAEHPTRDPTKKAMEKFGLVPSEYEFFTYQQNKKDFFSGLEIVGLLELIQLKGGDFLPVFFWDENNNILYTLKESDDGNFHLYTLQRNPNPDLSDNDFTQLWNQIEKERVISIKQ